MCFAYESYKQLEKSTWKGEVKIWEVMNPLPVYHVQDQLDV